MYSSSTAHNISRGSNTTVILDSTAVEVGSTTVVLVIFSRRTNTYVIVHALDVNAYSKTAYYISTEHQHLTAAVIFLMKASERRPKH